MNIDRDVYKRQVMGMGNTHRHSQFLRFLQRKVTSLLQIGMDNPILRMFFQKLSDFSFILSEFSLSLIHI